MAVIARWTVVKMLDGNWNVRDEDTGEWERDAVGLHKPTATKIANALNQHRGAVEALGRAHARLDTGHLHTRETWADRQKWTAAKLDAQ
jgi:hypothetical protein